MLKVLCCCAETHHHSSCSSSLHFVLVVTSASGLGQVAPRLLASWPQHPRPSQSVNECHGHASSFDEHGMSGQKAAALVLDPAAPKRSYKLPFDALAARDREAWKSLVWRQILAGDLGYTRSATLRMHTLIHDSSS